MIHYKIEQPRLNNTACVVLMYIDKDGNRITRNKKKFDTLDEAIEVCKKLNAQDTTIHKLVAYKCKTCFKYHIGRNGKLNKLNQNANKGNI